MPNNPIILTQKVLERFWKKVNKTESCWIWTGAKSPSGHGRFKINGLMYGPHRIVYTIYKGQIPKGMYICHRCPNNDNPSCCNPDHLYLGTPSQNCQDEVNKKNTRHFKCSNASKYNGVRWDKTRQGWISYVYLNKKLTDIGRHNSEIDAARNHDRIKYMKFGMKDGLNFPSEYNLSD